MVAFRAWGFVAALAVCTAWPAAAQQAGPSVAERYRAITADYQRLAAADRGAAARLAREAYRMLVADAAADKNLSPDDLLALAACREALGERAEAVKLVAQSLAAKPSVQGHLAAAQLAVASDAAAAERSFAEAAKLQADHPALLTLRLAIAAAYAKKRQWTQAATHLAQHLAATKALVDRSPGDAAAESAHIMAQRELDRARRYAAMTGKPAAAINALAWGQGAPVDLASLKGKPVLLVFAGAWAAASREQLAEVSELAAKPEAAGVEVLILSLANQHQYDPATDKVSAVQGLKVEDEAAGLGAYAKKHGLPGRVAIVDGATAEQYGVASLPHAVVIDKAGNVAAILLGDNARGDELAKAVAAAKGQ
jgi:hypothetical protein